MLTFHGEKKLIGAQDFVIRALSIRLNLSVVKS